MQSDEQEIRQLIETWLSATRAGDTEKVLSLMSDDVIFLVCGQPPMNKVAFAASQAALQQFDLEASSNIQEVEVVGDWAYVRTHLSILITPKSGGAAMKRAGNTLSILRKQNGNWLLVRDANMLAPVA
jgi:uncharacterized protein (TIGR02246 family)